jgi:predicted RNA-binding Zn-ribbon protein involved in translation (DUF1610 family)
MKSEVLNPKEKCWEKVLKTFPDDGYIYIQPLKHKYQKELNFSGIKCVTTESYVVEKMTNDSSYERFDVPTCGNCMMGLCRAEDSKEFDMEYCDNCEASLHDNIYYRTMFRKKAEG